MAKTRWYQISLRRLFLFVVVMGCILGPYMGRIRQNQAAIQAVERLGGSVISSEISETVFSRFHRRVFGTHSDAVVVGVRLSNCRFTDRDLECLERFDHLGYVFLDDTAVTDMGLEHLLRVRQLKQLWLDNTKITGNGLGQLSDRSGPRKLDQRRRERIGYKRSNAGGI